MAGTVNFPDDLNSHHKNSFSQFKDIFNNVPESPAIRSKNGTNLLGDNVFG